MKLKKIITLLSIAVLLMHCSPTDKKHSDTATYSIITGNYTIPYVSEVVLSKVENGELFKVSTCEINKNNEFGFAIKPDSEGFYLLTDKQRNSTPLYLKGNQFLKVQFNSDGYKIIEGADEENTTLSNWIQANDTLSYHTKFGSISTYEEFFPFYEKFLPEMEKEHDKVNTSNKKFNRLMHLYIDINKENKALSFLFSPRTKHPEKKDFPEFLNSITTTNSYTSTDVLKIPEGIATLRLRNMYNFMYVNEKKDNEAYLDAMLSNIPNDTLKGYMALKFLHQFKSYNEDYLKYIEPLRKNINLSSYAIEELDKYEVSIKKYEKGTPGYPFTYEDKNGKQVSFSDFKGKYVYIDVWATWCGPCKKEIPYLKQLEKDFHNKDIEFVSISMDKKKDKEKWLQFIKDKSLTGTQLFSDDAFNTRIAKDYKISSIPRFLLFDKEGKIIDANAKRPSNPKLKSELSTLLR